jgi:hypothetical protein
VPDGRPTSEVGYTLATTGRGDCEVHDGRVVAMENNNIFSCIISNLMLSHKPCSPTTCPCQIIANNPVILKLLCCDISSSKCSPPFQRNLLTSCTTKTASHPKTPLMLKDNLLLVYLPSSNIVILLLHTYTAKGDYTQGQRSSQL